MRSDRNFRERIQNLDVHLGLGGIICVESLCKLFSLVHHSLGFGLVHPLAELSIELYGELIKLTEAPGAHLNQRLGSSV